MEKNQDTESLEALLRELRRHRFRFQYLPDEIPRLIVSDDDKNTEKSIIDATVDEIAFAQQGISQHISLLIARRDALRQLHDMARGKGAFGGDRALEYIQAHGGISA